MKRFLHLCMPLVLLALLTGCIKDSYDDCEWYTLTFSYTADGATDVFAQHITDVSLYVYDADDRLVQTKRISHGDLKSFQGTKLNVAHGTYHIVGVGNVFSRTEIKEYNANDMSLNYFSHPNAEGNGAIDSNDSLYLGSKIITLPEQKRVTEDIAFRSSHLKISYKVIIESDDQIASSNSMRAAESLFALRVKNLTPLTDFNNATFGDPVTYTPELVRAEQGDDHEAYFNIMRHGKHNDVEFELVDVDTSTVLNTQRLEEFLAAYPQIDVTQQEVLIPIEVRLKYRGNICTDVTVTIPDWLVHDVTPEFGNN